MEVIEMLGVALGLAALAGVNLYLTVFVTGMAIHFHWVVLPASLSQLSVLGDPWVISVAGALYFLQFFADKVPWIDSVNDAVHTMIRPVGGALLAVLAMGNADPTVKVIAALLAGGVALTSHLSKAGIRLVANASPEPVSNIGLSLGEDAMVLGGLGLLAWHPLVAAAVFLLILGAIWALLPRLLRGLRASAYLAWRKLNELPADRQSTNTLGRIPRDLDVALRRAHATDEPVTFAVPCLSGAGPRLPRNLFGWLVQFEGGKVFFVGRRLTGTVVVEIPAPPNANAERESRFTSERLILRDSEDRAWNFLLERGHRRLADLSAERFGRKTQASNELVEVT